MSNPNIILYHANWSFCSQMVRVALLEKGFSFDERHIKLCDQYPEGENIDKDYLAINPLGTVPAIQIDGNTICGSAEIIYQLDKIDTNNAYSLYPNNVRKFYKPHESLTQFIPLTFIEKGEELHFIGDDNFRAIARYNISDVYAMAVYYLAEEFKK